MIHGPGQSSPSGIALVLASLILCLGWIFALRRLPEDTDPVAASCAVVVIGALIIVPLALVRSGVPPLRLATVTWVSILGQSVLATVIAIVAWQYGAARLPAASAGVFLNIEPLVGAAAGILLFHDTLTGSMLLGGAAIIAGSILVTRGSSTALA